MNFQSQFLSYNLLQKYILDSSALKDILPHKIPLGHTFHFQITLNFNNILPYWNIFINHQPLIKILIKKEASYLHCLWFKAILNKMNFQILHHDPNVKISAVKHQMYIMHSFYDWTGWRERHKIHGDDLQHLKFNHQSIDTWTQRLCIQYSISSRYFEKKTTW